jgi:hypothetical protein
MKKIFTIILFCGVVCSYAQNTPPHAASTQTWAFKMWSAAIQMPECNKEECIESATDPQCRSYTHGENTFYYYNWPYVMANGAKMCPAPWRMPTKLDFDELASSITENLTLGIWGYGGYAIGNVVYDMGAHAYYWSSTPQDDVRAHLLYYTGGGTHIYTTQIYSSRKYNGFQVRCVK